MINFGSGSIGKIYGIWSNMPFLGQFASSDGKIIEIDKSAKMFEYGYGSNHEITCAVTSYKKDNIVVSCYERDNSEKRVNSEIEIKLVEGRYQFERNGKTYIQQI